MTTDELIKILRETDFSDGCPCSAEELCKDKDCLIWQAADAIEALQRACANYAEQAMENEWVSVKERLPENNVHVLLACKCGIGSYVCDGFHTEKYSTPTEFYEDIDADYNEETDEYYFPEGWWEVIKNWDDYSCVSIEDTVTHWMPLPEPPKEDEA